MSPSPTLRGPDWLNAAGFFFVTLAVPVLATDTVLLDIMFGPGYLSDEVRFGTVLLPWLFWLVVAPYELWWVWQGKVTVSTIRVDRYHIVGRTGWPVRRWRSVDLHQLSHVRYHRRFWPQRSGELFVNGYIALRDQAGGRLAVTFPHRRRERDREIRDHLRSAVLDALERSPTAHANDLTRRRLNGETSRRAVTLGVVANLVLVGIVVLMAVALTVLLLYQAGAIGPY
jgi:hypothetical protein